MAFELPMFVGQIHAIKVTPSLDILLLTTNCTLRLFSLSKRKLYVNTNIVELLNANLGLEGADKTINRVVEFMDVS